MQFAEWLNYLNWRNCNSTKLYFALMNAHCDDVTLRVLAQTCGNLEKLQAPLNIEEFA